jgi:hypothetical protein
VALVIVAVVVWSFREPEEVSQAVHHLMEGGIVTGTMIVTGARDGVSIQVRLMRVHLTILQWLEP